MSNAIVKNLNFGLDAKNNVFAGITKLTQAVSSTLGASGKCVMLEDGTGKVINETAGTDGFAAESYTVDAAGLVIETKAGTTSGSASILNGVTTT